MKTPAKITRTLLLTAHSTCMLTMRMKKPKRTQAFSDNENTRIASACFQWQWKHSHCKRMLSVTMKTPALQAHPGKTNIRTACAAQSALSALRCLDYLCCLSLSLTLSRKNTKKTRGINTKLDCFIKQKNCWYALNRTKQFLSTKSNVSLIWQPIFFVFNASPYHHKSVTILPLLALKNALFAALGYASGMQTGMH